MPAIACSGFGFVWRLTDGKSALSLHEFKGAFIDKDGKFCADFPNVEDVDRNIVRFDLNSGQASLGPKVESKTAYQDEAYLIRFKPSTGKANEDNWDFRFRNVLIEVLDARSLKALWSRTYTKEGPDIWTSSRGNWLVSTWGLNSETAKDSIRDDAKLNELARTVGDKGRGLFFEVSDWTTGNVFGKLIVDTGNGSSRISNILAVGDLVIATDTNNRVLVYSLKTWALKGRAFGGYAAVSPDGTSLCVENEKGKLAFYDTESFAKRDELIFPGPIAVLRYSDDGKRLLLLSRDQTVYLIDVENNANFARDSSR